MSSLLLRHELRRLASIRRFLTCTATPTLASAFVLSRIYYLNSLLFGSTNFIGPPVKVENIYKIACLCYHCHSNTAPSYVNEMLKKNPSYSGNTSTSHTMPLLNRPASSKITHGDRSFSFAFSSFSNSIPNDFKCDPSLSSFKFLLKAYLFRPVYKE